MTTFNIKFDNIEELQLVTQALGQMPFIKVQPLILKISEQVGAQLQAASKEEQNKSVPQVRGDGRRKSG